MTDTTMTIIRRKIEEIWNERKLVHINKLFAPNYIHHDPYNPEVRDLAGYRTWLIELQTAFPDLYVLVDDIITENNKVVMRWTMYGTQMNEYRGTLPTGRRVRITGINVFYLQDERIVETWSNYDIAHLMEQLGALSIQAHACEDVMLYPAYT